MRTFLTIVIGSTVIACSGAPNYAALPNDAGRVIRIDMSDFAFSPPTISLRPGERVTLSFRNIGSQEHEFMAGKDAVAGKGFMKDWLALAKVDAPSGQHDAGHVGEGLRLAPRGAANVTIIVPSEAGQFEFACFVVGHYESGMKGMLTVEAGAAPSAAPTAARTPTARPTTAPGHTMDAEDAEQH